MSDSIRTLHLLQDHLLFKTNFLLITKDLRQLLLKYQDLQVGHQHFLVPLSPSINYENPLKKVSGLT